MPWLPLPLPWPFSSLPPLSPLPFHWQGSAFVDMVHVAFATSLAWIHPWSCAGGACVASSINGRQVMAPLLSVGPVRLRVGPLNVAIMLFVVKVFVDGRHCSPRFAVAIFLLVPPGISRFLCGWACLGYPLFSSSFGCMAFLPSSSFLPLFGLRPPLCTCPLCGWLCCWFWFWCSCRSCCWVPPAGG